MFKGNHIRLSAGISADNLQVRRKWQDIFKVPKGKNFQPWIFYPARLSVRIEEVIKRFPDKQKL